MRLPSLRNGLLLAGSVVALAVGASPLLVVGADHLDAPALGGLTTGGAFNPPGSLHSDHGDRDINDVYVFQGSNSSRTVLAMTTNPAINLFGGSFGKNVRYVLNVDTNGNAIQNVAYVFRFGPVANGAQHYTVTRYTNSNARSLTMGTVVATGSTAGNGVATWTRDGTKAFAGVRSDPFFFDLTGFVGSVLGLGTDRLGTNPTDFFDGLNTNAIVLEVPDSALGGNIGVWGVTQYWANGMWNAADQMGRPAINTVFNNSRVDPNSGQTKDRFNTTPPSQQRTAYSGLFRNNIIATLTNINQAVLHDGCTDYDAATAGVIANILLPDVITYDTTTSAQGPLNGRALSDDVIDAELAITTNSCPAASSDGVGAHSDYLSTFPYLGTPHP